MRLWSYLLGMVLSCAVIAIVAVVTYIVFWLFSVNVSCINPFLVATCAFFVVQVWIISKANNKAFATRPKRSERQLPWWLDMLWAFAGTGIPPTVSYAIANWQYHNFDLARCNVRANYDLVEGLFAVPISLGATGGVAIGMVTIAASVIVVLQPRDNPRSN